MAIKLNVWFFDHFDHFCLYRVCKLTISRLNIRNSFISGQVISWFFFRYKLNTIQTCKSLPLDRLASVWIRLNDCNWILDSPRGLRRPIACTDRPGLGRRPANRRAPWLACRLFGCTGRAVKFERGRRARAAHRCTNSIRRCVTCAFASTGRLCRLQRSNQNIGFFSFHSFLQSLSCHHTLPLSWVWIVRREDDPISPSSAIANATPLRYELACHPFTRFSLYRSLYRSNQSAAKLS